MKEDASATLESYLVALKNKNPEEAYKLLDEDYLPEKESFENTVKSQNLSYSILESKTVDSDLVKFLVDIQIDEESVETPFIVLKKGDKWFVSLQGLKGEISY